MKTIRGGRGLGDTLYLQAIVRYLVAQHDEVIQAASDFPDVFRTLGRRVRVIPFTRVGVGIVAHYVARKGMPGTTQFEDMCLSAGIRKPVDLVLDWKVIDEEIVRLVKAPGKPVICVQLPRAPMGRTDGFGHDILPNCDAIQHALEALAGRVTIVQIGAGKPLYSFRGVVDINLADQTSVSQLLDVASVADGFVGYPSFIVPLAECFDQPSLIVWSALGLQSLDPFINRIAPGKVLHKKTSRAVIDTMSREEIANAAVAQFLHKG